MLDSSGEPGFAVELIQPRRRAGRHRRGGNQPVSRRILQPASVSALSLQCTVASELTAVSATRTAHLVRLLCASVRVAEQVESQPPCLQA
jgi:hypothetical protein